MTTDIVFETRNHIGVITLSRQQALNALNLPMIKALQLQLSQWQTDATIHAVILQAAPGKAFCAGGDVRWLYETGLAHNPVQMEFFWHEYRLNHYINQFSKPFIVLMDGITMGGGVGISLHGSFPVASERFVFAMPETSIGLFPDIGASYLLSRTPGQLGFYLALTGNRLGANDAYAASLVKQVIASERLAEILPALETMDLSRNAPSQVDVYLKSLANPLDRRALLVDEFGHINQYFSAGSVKEILGGLEKSNDPWAQTTFNTLQQKSPLSLEVTFAQLQKVKSQSLAFCLKMDYCLVSHFMADKDFYEGVRAILIDKDKNPKWQPESLTMITAADVANYFECDKPDLVLIGE